jgi:hypothetical protein
MTPSPAANEPGARDPGSANLPSEASEPGHNSRARLQYVYLGSHPPWPPAICSIIGQIAQ